MRTSPRCLVLLVVAAVAAIPTPRLSGQDTPQKETEALRRQVKDLQKQIEELRRENEALKRRADAHAAEAQRQRQRAEAEQAAALRLRREAEEQRKRAAENFRRAAKALEEEWLDKLSPKGGKPSDTGKENARKELLARALAFYQKLLQDKDASREQKAQASWRLGDIHRKLGRPAEAEAAYRSALELQRKLVEDFPAIPRHRHDLGRGYLRLGELNRDTGRLKEAEQSLRQGIVLLEKLVKEFPTAPEYRKDLGQGYGQLGRVMQLTGRPREARELAERAAQLEK